jgi:alanyl-tRNA synthetase
MQTTEIRSRFLDFFAERGHTVVPSSSLVPDDPTLLLTNAGMVQFKPYFLGEKTAPYRRAASVQKCFRAIDLEVVGMTSRHMTFFEMLGNFSFGDYFKPDACRWGWELLTEGFGLEPGRLWATVFETDDEAARIWEEEVGIPTSRILRRGREAGNFWDMGVAGPCGPCSELLYDRGPEFGPEFGGGELSDERYLEVWNLVFMQSLQDERFQIVGDLPSRNVDTGMGLERLAAILQGARTVFEVDSLLPVLRAAEEITGNRYGQSAQSDLSLRVLTEHARSMTMLIADGVLPSNEWRGYVLRRLIRRAVRHTVRGGIDQPVLVQLAKVVIEMFANVYPEVDRNRELIERVLEREESSFDLTFRRCLGQLEDEIAMVKQSGGNLISGEFAFKLHDECGLHIDLIIEIAREEGLGVDKTEFDQLMTGQRTRARAARTGTAVAIGGGLPRATGVKNLGDVVPTEFVGYESLTSDGNVIALLEEQRERVRVLTEGNAGEIVLSRTSFYAEGGGQVGDRGEIKTATGVFAVEGTHRPLPGLFVHFGRVVSGEIEVDQQAETNVDLSHREGVRQSHTATHMLHWALRGFLGEHARQQGSLVEPGRLRFDFSHFEAVGDERLAGLEEEVNRRVLTDDPVRAFETTFDYATSIGAMALFGEKYGEFVRVVEVGEYSKELCGGTHVIHTGQVGVVKVISEGSVAAGVRRIEALTGMAGLQYLNAQAGRLQRVAGMLRVAPDGVVERLEKTLDRIKDLEAQLSKQKSAGQQDEIASILQGKAAGPFGPRASRLVVERTDGRPVDDLRKLAVGIRDKIGSGVVVIASAQDGKANLVAAVTQDLVRDGISATDIVAGGAQLLGGGKGGKPDLAIGGGPRGEEIERALETVSAAARAALRAG